MGDESRRPLQSFREHVDAMYRRIQEVEEATHEERVDFREVLEELNVALEELQQTSDELSVAEEARDAERRRYMELFEFAPDGYLVLDGAGVVLEANPAAAGMLGIEAKALVGTPVWPFVEKDDRRALSSKLQYLQRAADNRPTSIDIHLQPRNSHAFAVGVTLLAVPTGSNGSVVLHMMIHDTSALHDLQAALLSEKQRLAATLASLGEGVIATDENGKIVLLNQVASDITGWPERTALGREVHEVLPLLAEDTLLPAEDPVRLVLEQRERLAKRSAYLVGPNGSQRLLAYWAAPVGTNHDDIEGVVLVFADVTQERWLQDEVVKMQKLESVGVLAGGIAHDFNNLLTVIQGNVSLVKLRSRPGYPAHSLLSESEAAVADAQRLTQQLLTFARGGAPVRRLAAMGPLVQSACLFGLRGSKSRRLVKIDDNIWPAEVDSGQIAQVISNLMLNSDQAMPQGGSVTVGVRNVVVQEGELPALDQGPYVCISISDQGIGIPREHLSRIFEPYFTTKAKGSGLGLSVVYSIVRGHRGHIAVESQLGQGSRFDVYLPAQPDAQPAEPGVGAQPATQPGNSRGRVLVMDDNDQVLAVARGFLEYLGYAVSTALDGAEAVRLYRQALSDGGRYDVVMLDLTVPGGMGGKETVQVLHAIDPHVVALIASGYGDGETISHFRDNGFAGVLSKPYTIEVLDRALREVTARAAEQS